MSKNGCEWVRMGLYGCVEVQEAWGNPKTMHAHAKTVVQALTKVLWSGKVPRTSCFLAYGEFG